MPSLYINDTTFFGLAKLSYSACLWGFCALELIAQDSFSHGTDEPLARRVLQARLQCSF